MHNTQSNDFIMNFEADWRDFLVREIESLGYSRPTKDDAETLYFMLENIKMRNVERKPRKIYASNALACPPELAAGFAELQKKILNGDDLRPHLSTGILNAQGRDLLLNDWGIHHFHLGLGSHPKKAGFTSRTGPILFARVTDDAFYMIVIREHGEWADEHLVEILHRNWPDTIAKYRMTNAIPQWPNGQKPSCEERQALRNAGVNVLIELEDGSVYHPLNLGITSAGTNIGVTIRFNNHMRALSKIQTDVVEVMPEVIRGAKENGVDMAPPYKLRIVGSHNGCPVILEENSNHTFVLHP